MAGKPGADVVRICKKCGEPYHPNSTRQQCCNKPIKVPCVVCGKLMDQICTFSRQNSTCSKECSTALGNIQRETTAKKLTRKCKWCGKEFHPKSARDVYCDDIHYATCEVCGKQFEVTGRYHAHNKTCSDECRYISAKQNTDMGSMKKALRTTMLSKYGVENAMQIPGSIDKIKATTQAHYGVDWYVQTDEYRTRVKKTCREKYGTDHHLAAKSVQDKRLKTVQEKFGVDNVFQNNAIKEKSKDTNLSRYGVSYVSQSPEIHKRMYINRSNNVAKDGKLFDSSYERIFYDFLLQLSGIIIETQVPIEFDYQGVAHTTLIDFKVDNIYFEVKGSHLLNGVFDSKSQIPIATKLDVYRKNNVIVITDTNIASDGIFGTSLVGIDISLIAECTEPAVLWDKILQHIKWGNGLLAI